MGLIDEEHHRRLIMRLCNELQVQCGTAILRQMDGRIGEGVVFALVLRELCRKRPEAENRHLSINGLASSLFRPFETIRRHVQTLQSLDLLLVTSSGILLGKGAANVAQQLAQTIADYFDNFVVDLQRARLWRNETREGHIYEKSLASLDLYFSAIEFNGALMKNWPLHLAVGTLLTLNVRHISRDLNLSKLYARFEDVPPVELRRPATVNEIAAECGLPIETVRRYLKQMYVAGQITRVDRGYLVGVDYLSDPDVQVRALQIAAYMRRVLADYAAGKYMTGDELFATMVRQ